MARANSWTSHIIWGSVAVCAVLAAAVMIALAVGSHRGIQIAAPAKRSPPAPLERVVAKPPVSLPVDKTSEHEIARLNDALRLLAAERDRLAERLEAVERTLGDITASVQRPPAPTGDAAEPARTAPTPTVDLMRGDMELAKIAAASVKAAPARGGPPAPGPAEFATGEIFQRYAAAHPVVVPPEPGQAPMQIHATPRTPSVASAPQPNATRTEFAIDLGSESSLENLRARWVNLRDNHNAALAALRPLASIREGNRPGGIELRLIAGPLANAEDAARTCASLQAKGVNCQTTVFDGQRIALR